MKLPSDSAEYDAPFLYDAQFRLAHQLIAVPYTEMHRLAQACPLDASKLILIYSIGRCGSTLVSQAFSACPNVASLSEPDVFSQLLMLRNLPGTSRRAADELQHSCMTLQCAAAHHRLNADRFAIKFRSFGTGLAEPLHRLFPQATRVFLQRELGSWARSVCQAFGLLDQLTPEFMTDMNYGFARMLRGVAEGIEQKHFFSPTELIGSMWLSAMEDHKAMAAQPPGTFVADYADLKRRPIETLEALFDYCRITDWDADTLARCVAKDSQAGSSLAQNLVRSTKPNPLLERYVAEIGQFVARAQQAQ